jgi:hypothetical protein
MAVPFLARPSELDAARLDGGDDGRAAQLVGGGGIGERLGLVLVHLVRDRGSVIPGRREAASPESRQYMEDWLPGSRLRRAPE